MDAQKWFSNKPAEFENDPEFIAEELVLEIIVELNRALKEQGITRRELAQRLGTSPSFVSEVLNGKPNMTLLTLCKFAEALGLRVSANLTPKRSAKRGPSVSGAPRVRRKRAASGAG